MEQSLILKTKNFVKRPFTKIRTIFCKFITERCPRISEESPHREISDILFKTQGSSPQKKIFLISDLHLNHKNIIKYCHRPFSSIEEMNKTMVYRWNATVKKTDIVYSVGDFIWYEIQGEHLLARFNGKIIFIDGNHGVECNFPETKHHIIV